MFIIHIENTQFQKMSFGQKNHTFHIMLCGFRRYREKVIEHTSHLTDMHIGIVRGTAPFALMIILI